MTTTRTNPGAARARLHTAPHGVLISASMVPRWRARAACADLVCDEEWFPPSGRVSPMVLRVCRGCPVRRACLLFALGQPDLWYGIWAGLTARELADLRDRLLAGEPAAHVIHLAESVVEQRTTPPIYHAGAPHPLPSRRRLRRQRQQLTSMLPTPDRHEQHAVTDDRAEPAALLGGAR